MESIFSRSTIQPSPKAPNGCASIRHRCTATRILLTCGLHTALIGVVGDDPEGRELAALLGKLQNVEADLIAMRGRPTTLKTRFVAGSQQLLRVDAEEVAGISQDTENQLGAASGGGVKCLSQ